MLEIKQEWLKQLSRRARQHLQKEEELLLHWETGALPSVVVASVDGCESIPEGPEQIYENVPAMSDYGSRIDKWECYL